MTDWAEHVAHHMVSTRDRRALEELGGRPAWATEQSDEFPPVAPATGRASVNDAHFSLIGKAGTLTPLQARRANGRRS